MIVGQMPDDGSTGIATRNVAHLHGLGVPIYDPFEDVYILSRHDCALGGSRVVEYVDQSEYGRVVEWQATGTNSGHYGRQHRRSTRQLIEPSRMQGLGLGCDQEQIDVLVDLAPGALMGARVEQEGIAAVLVELANVIPVHGEDAEVRVAVFDRVVAATVALEKLCAHEIVL